MVFSQRCRVVGGERSRQCGRLPCARYLEHLLAKAFERRAFASDYGPLRRTPQPLQTPHVNALRPTRYRVPRSYMWVPTTSAPQTHHALQPNPTHENLPGICPMPSRNQIQTDHSKCCRQIYIHDHQYQCTPAAGICGCRVCPSPRGQKRATSSRTHYRLASLTLLTAAGPLTLINCYAPQNGRPLGERRSFYEDLQGLVDKLQK